MKDIHPKYFSKATIHCANCNNTFTAGATQEEIRVEICYNCHPFFTGKKVFIDTEGRVDSFRMKMQAATGPRKKVNKKKTLEEKVNIELAAQLAKK